MLIRMFSALGLVADAIPWSAIREGLSLRELLREGARLARHPLLLYRLTRAMIEVTARHRLLEGPVYPWVADVVEALRRSPDWPAVVAAWGEPDEAEMREGAHLFEVYRDEARARLYRSGIQVAAAAGGAAAVAAKDRRN